MIIKHKKYITFNDREEIEKSLKEGKTYEKIARFLKRSLNGVAKEIKRGGGRRLYSAEIAQENFLSAFYRDKNKIDKINLENAQPNTNIKIESPEIKQENDIYCRMQQQIKNLEMQVEILYDTIKEILKSDKKN